MSKACTSFLLALLLLLPASAQPLLQTDLGVDAWFSVGDNIHPDRFLAITVQLENRAAERDLTLLVKMNQLQVLEPIRVRVPAGARQQFQFAVPRFEGWNNEIDLLVRQGSRQVGGTKIRYETMAEGLAVTVLCPEGQSAFGYLQAYNDLLANSGSNPSIRLSTPPLQGLPAHWSGYLGTDMIVLYDLARLELTSSQQAAVVDWARAGGTLVLISTGDPGEYQGTPLEAILPLQPSGSRDEPGFPMVTGELRPGALQVKERGGHPTLVSCPAVGGMVFQYTFPILTDTVLGSEATRAYWQKAIVHANSSQQDNHNFGMRTENLLRTLQEMLLPNPGLLAWLLLGYVLLVGPVNFAILKKKDRMLWIFVTVPVLAVAFTLGMFITTQVAHGTESVLREMSRLRLVSGERRGLMDSQLTVFSPFPGSVSGHCPPTSTVILERVGGMPEPQPAVRLTEEMSYQDIPMQMASMRRFSARSVPELEGPISFTLERKGGQAAVLKVSNKSGLTLRNCCLVVSDRASGRFDLDAGDQSLTVDLGASDAHTLAVDLLKDVDDADGRRQDCLDLMSRELNMAQAGKSIMLLGWTDKLSCELELSSKPRKLRTCLVEVELR